MNRFGLRLSTDETGGAIAQANAEFRLLALFLETDVQGDSRECEYIIQLIDDITSGRDSFSQSTGNAHMLTLTQDHARFESLYEDPSGVVELTLEEFRAALAAWCHHIRTIYGQESSE